MGIALGVTSKKAIHVIELAGYACAMGVFIYSCWSLGKTIEGDGES